MWSVGKLWVCSKWTHQYTHEPLFERTLRVLSQFCSRCAHNMPEPLIESSFIKYPSMWPQCAQWVLFKELTTNSQCGSILPQTLKELTEYMVEYIEIKLPGILWKNSQWVARVHSGHILIKIVKEPRGFIHKIPSGFFDGFFLNLISTYPPITLKSKWWVSCKRTLNLPTRQSVSKLFKNSQQTHNVPARYTPLCPQWNLPGCHSWPSRPLIAVRATLP